MHYLAFNKEWFTKHQRFLIFLLNAPLIKRWFRWIMRIKKQDCPLNKRINRIMPNHYVMGAYRNGDEIILTTDFRTHWKYAKRLYYAFKPMWWAMHYWDELLADRFIPWLSFGFATLTAYPDANPETTSVDGRFYKSVSPPNWASVRDATSSDAAPDSETSAQTLYLAHESSAGGSTQINRAIYLFDTSSIGTGQQIDNTTFSVFGLAGFDNDHTETAHVVSSSPASNTALVADDFDQFGSTSFGSVVLSAWSTSAYNDITLNASGRANISMTGVSKFGMRLQNDLNNTAPTQTDNAFSFVNNYFADQTGTTNDPKLVVTYSVSVAATSIPTSLLLGVG